MVFFVCEGCNESIKKPQVDKHAARCSSCYAVTCVDCNVTFHGDDYRAHTSCISEAERYERTVYRGVRKGEKGKGGKQTPQDAWNAIVEEARERKAEAGANIRDYLCQLCDCENVPRKEKQFKNFTANSLRLRGKEREVGMMWDFLAKLRAEKNEIREAEKKKESEEEERKKAMVKKELEEKEAKEKEAKEKEESGKNKRKAPSDSTSDSTDSSAAVKVIKKILKSSPSNSLKLKSLRAQSHAKLVKKDIYKGENDDSFKKFIKKIVKNSDKFSLEAKHVTLN
ncbi:hypothetical protein TrCOL_g765 [Triparma columacea]|jgi:cell growth-regulating nucleolar protein|uniref:Zinc finger C2H2 LYAR-type domain-containing protein n=1 Tax=Triparma columacea TaxID=722753 RepID=A0A9W7L438_9STRA|nr:hypothetical protein TrCOL_g765 [Triparma columacea]